MRTAGERAWDFIVQFLTDTVSEEDAETMRNAPDGELTRVEEKGEVEWAAWQSFEDFLADPKNWWVSAHEGPVGPTPLLESDEPLMKTGKECFFVGHHFPAEADEPLIVGKKQEGEGGEEQRG